MTTNIASFTRYSSDFESTMIRDYVVSPSTHKHAQHFSDVFVNFRTLTNVDVYTANYNNYIALRAIEIIGVIPGTKSGNLMSRFLRSAKKIVCMCMLFI